MRTIRVIVSSFTLVIGAILFTTGVQVGLVVSTELYGWMGVFLAATSILYMLAETIAEYESRADE